MLSAFSLHSSSGNAGVLTTLGYTTTENIGVRLLVSKVCRRLFLTKDDSFRTLTSCRGIRIKICGPIAPIGLFGIGCHVRSGCLVISRGVCLLNKHGDGSVFLKGRAGNVGRSESVLICSASRKRKRSLGRLRSCFRGV